MRLNVSRLSEPFLQAFNKNKVEKRLFHALSNKFILRTSIKLSSYKIARNFGVSVNSEHIVTTELVILTLVTIMSPGGHR